ncbi:glutathione transferase [Paecilomyces variotii]|uniref:Glutathione transferase n=1 Tax=Byssochlamys spectabilis TaxID=264951 RepID=A0A443HRN5_BYSSP|nr:glutathione transferase [Paecilomyces variotii]RWQ94502.1 glutathione transferase [Paecilomyces variotii]
MDSPDLQHLPVNLRNLQSAASLQNLSPNTLASQLASGFDTTFQTFPSTIAELQEQQQQHQQQQQHLQSVTSKSFVRPPRPGEQVNDVSVLSQEQQRSSDNDSNGGGGGGGGGGQYAVVPPPPRPGQTQLMARNQTSMNSVFQPRGNNQFEMLHSLEQQPLQHNAIMQLQKEGELLGGSGGEPVATGKSDGHFGGMKLIPYPPDLEAWRERLFNVDETITLTEEQFQTYFPHVDNVYSHRSTQRYKRKPFVSHYWDCRLKGRPPGTPKSDDPNKKKRRRTARQRDLCDVKIKITEHFPASMTPADVVSHMAQLPPELQTVNPFFNPGDNPRENQPFGVLTPNPTLPEGHPAAHGARYFTIQRVNGNGANGKADGVGGGHRHTLEESDRVKKNSVQRWMLKEAKEQKKAMRVWIALEVKGIPYQYIEVDPYKKPEALLEVNPRGLVPALRHGNWGCHESTVLLEYLEDLDFGTPLLPPGDAKLRAHCRLWADHINRHIIPAFYRVLQEQDPQKQVTYAEELKDDISKLVNASHVHGPFFLGPNISMVDIHIAPWILRLSRVLKPYRGWPDPEMGSRWAAWVNAIESNEHVQATTSSDDLYLDSYERYAENRPNTSQLANAINSGRGLP